MKKRLYIFVLLIILGCFLAYQNKDQLLTYFSNQDWKQAEVTGTTTLSNHFAIDGTSSNLIVVGNNYLHGFSNNGEENFDLNVSLKNAVTSATGDYCIIGEKDGTKVYMINSNAKIWEMDIQGTILDVSVNKNGYSAIIYKQVGYKSLIKVVKPDGTELFTTYLASTYALDAEISNDNKILAVAEINTEGIKVGSIIELINMSDLEKKNSSKFALEDGTLVTNIEYNSKNKLLIQTDSGIQIVDNNELKMFVEDFDDGTKFVTIENESSPVVISKVENGLFETSYVLKIFDYKENDVSYEEYQIDDSPSIIASKDNKIAMLIEKELIIVNLNGKLLKKYDVSGNIKSIIIFNNGNSLAVVYRDKIEFMKI
ncbi:MAG: hypothetical protein IJX99_01780 [Clostridia bacterium]|nr:hypothetical protein [Clostridia bacterium]